MTRKEKIDLMNVLTRQFDAVGWLIVSVANMLGSNDKEKFDDIMKNYHQCRDEVRNYSMGFVGAEEETEG